MNDDLLGSLAHDHRLESVLVGAIRYNGAQVNLRLDPDGMPLSECIGLAREAVAALATIDTKARAVAASQLLATYNSHWREYQEVDSTGKVVDISNPELTEAEFARRIRLTSLDVTGNELCCLEYDDDRLFAGHAIFVSSFDGMGFTDPFAELFG